MTPSSALVLVLAACLAGSTACEVACSTPGGGPTTIVDDHASLLQQLKRRSAVLQKRQSRQERLGKDVWKGTKLQGGCRSKFKNRGTKHGRDKVNGPTLDAIDIPKYVTPVLIPPVMKNVGENSYEIAVRQFKQQVLPGGIWNNDAFNSYHGGKQYRFPPTTVWGFGPADDPEPNSEGYGGGKGIGPAPNSQFSFPGATVETISGEEVKVEWINHLVKDPWKCDWRKPPKCHGAYWLINARRCCRCQYLRHITPVDQSLHWANPGGLPCMDKDMTTDCMPKNVRALKDPYQGPVPMVVHLHGAHCEPQSDGFPSAWWLPAASNIPKHFSRHGRFVNKYGAGRKTNHRPGVASFAYRNDQPSTALWFHDHTLGMTRNNVYVGPVAFWLIRKLGGGDDGLLFGTLPHPAPKAGESFEEVNLPPGRNKYREVPLVILDRSFNLDGSLFYPGDRAFFEGLPPRKLQIPFLGDWTKKTDVPPIWNPEAFFDVMVVNGVSWPLMEVEPDIYRFRLLNGCNSRTLNLAIFVIGEDGEKQREMSFYIIGSDQSMLPNVTMVQTGKMGIFQNDGQVPTWEVIGPSDDEALLMGPAYRVDVLVDFTELTAGMLVQIFNTGPDSPFGGFPVEEPANPETTGQVMRFRVVADTPAGEDATPPKDLKLSLVDATSPAADPTLTDARDLALLEFASAKVCVNDPLPDGTVKWDPRGSPDAATGKCLQKNGEDATSTPFAPIQALLGINGRSGPDLAEALEWADPIATNPGNGSTETWELWDLTEDAHPIHLHLVKFMVHGRQKFNATTGVLEAMVPAGPTERLGWKDTIVALPGWVTYVKAEFDIPGLYVWHCHMLEHEDNEMMLPYCVGDMEDAPGCKFFG